VTIGSVALSGANVGDYAITSNNCPSTPTSLGAGASCNVQITFTPSANGLRNAAITFTDNATGSPQTLSISGTGQTLTYTLGFNPASLTFAAQNLSTTSAAQGVTISNTGNSPVTFSGFALAGANAGDFSVTGNTCPSSPTTLIAGANCSISVTFTPSAVGARTASIAITDNATGSPQSIGLTGTGQVTNMTLSFNPTSLTFAALTIHDSSAQQGFTIFSTGTAAVTLSSIAITGTNASDFSIASTTCPPSSSTLAAGSNCAVYVVFTPSAAGTRTASVTITDSATGSPQTVALTGTGQSPSTTVSISPANITFTTPQNIGVVSAQSGATITNTGTGPVLFNSFVLGGADPGDFTITENTCPNPPANLTTNQSCAVYVTFTPSAAGTRTATITIADNATGTPQTVTITGTGQTVTRTLTFSPVSYTFPTPVTVGVTAAQTYTYVTNTGNNPVTFTSIQITGANAADFSITNSSGCPYTGGVLTAGNACYLYFNFTPSAVGTRTASITFTDNATGSPQTVTVGGTGQAPSQSLSFSPVLIAYSSIQVGSTSNNYTYITNTGTSPVNLTGFSFTGPDAGDFTYNSVNSNCTTATTLPVNGACYVYVYFTPAATGSRTATLQITDTASGSPQSVNLSGTGSSTTQLVVTPATLTFGGQNTGTTSAGMNVTVYNTTSNAIAFTSALLSGANPGDFAVATNTCGASIAASANCVITVTFSPTATGARTATLSLTDGATNSPQSVTLSGTGQTNSQILKLYSTFISFPVTNLNATASQSYVQLTNAGTGAITIAGASISGTNPTDFAISQNTCPVPPATLATGASCYIYATFSPQAIGNRTATLSISSNALGSPQAVTLTGSGQANTNQLRLYNPAITFSSQLVGTTQAQTYVQVTNQGTSTATFSSISISGANAGDFAITNSTTCFAGTTLTAGASCYVYATFTPSAIGLRTAILSFVDNSTGSPQTAVLSGTGISSTTTLSLSYDEIAFGSTLLGTTAAEQYFYIYNVGNSPVTLNSFTLTGPNAADFAISNNECMVSPQTIAGGGNCYVYLVFTPSVVGSETATLQIADTAPGSPQVVQLTGIGQSQTTALQVSPNGITFGSLNVGTSTAATGNYFYLYNRGTQPIGFTSFTITGANSGDFSLGQNTCPSSPSTLAGGGNCYSYVIFTPSAIGPRTASVTITDTAPDSPQTVSLVGIGTPIETLLTVNPSSLSFGTQNVGVPTAATANYFYIYNRGTAPVTFSAAFSLQGTNAADFAIPSGTCPVSPATLAVGGSCYEYVTFTPSLVGPESAYIQISDNAAGSPQIVNLAGIGQAPTQYLYFAPSTYVFGAQAVGTTSGATYVYVVNQGTTAVSFTSFALTGGNAGDFAISSNGCPTGSTTLAPASGCYIYLTFTPSAAGQRNTTLQLTDSAAGSPQSIPVTGAASVPVFYSQLSEVSFGVQNVGTTASPRGFSIYNEGIGAMNLSSIAITGAHASDFAISFNNCPSSLTASAGCTLNVTFTPSIVGPETAAVQFTDNAPGSPHLVNLIGIGQAVTNNTLTTNLTELTYTPQNTGTTGGAQSFSMYNYGTGPITITGISLGGANASDFGISFNNCGSSLTAGSGCTVSLTFTPTASGPRTATVLIASSAVGSPQSVSLFGTGLPPTEDVIVSLDTLVFAAQNVGTTSGEQAFAIYNYGTGTVTFAASNPFTIAGANSGDYSISYNNCGSTLTTGSGCTVEVTFRPSALGVRIATLQIADDAPGSPQVVNLIGTGQPVTDTLDLSETALQFAPQTVGVASSERSFSVYNEGTGTLTFAASNAFTITGTNSADFAISFNNCGSSLTPGAGCTIEVIFTPSIVGAEAATLQITDSAPDSPETVALMGTGQANTQIAYFDYSSLTFAAQNIGTTSAVQTNYLYNEGTTTMTITGVSIVGANAGDFAISTNQCGSTLGVAGSCYIQVSFTPTAAGPRSATLQVTDSAPGSPHTYSLFGTGTVAVQSIGLEYSALTFAAQTVGTTSGLQTDYIYNVGNAATTFSGFNITGPNASEFSISTNGCSSTLAAGGSCYVQLTFTPAGTGQRVANLQISDTATGSPQVINLYGTGQ
jgi:hypothetical protein